MEKIIGLAIYLVVFLLLDLYAYQSFRTLLQNKYTIYIYCIITLVVLSITSYIFITTERKSSDSFSIQLLLGLLIVFYLPKIFLIIPLLLEDIFRTFSWIFSYFSEKESHFPSRRKAISLIAVGVASIPFLSAIYGIFKGKFQYKIHRITLKFKDLPQAFDGYKMVQLSDIHSGSFKEEHKDEILRGIELVNNENADLILFTGDFVNFVAEEVKPFIDVFKQIKGVKYSVIGNHDYGIYAYKKTDEKSIQKNISKLQEYEAEMGFTMLRNETVSIERNNEKINIIGVENYGTLGRFPQTGDLDKATQTIGNNEFNILMSHDPTHFDEVIKNYKKHIHITLAGHTHGMQLGVELPFLKFSPVQFIYKKWAGLYEENKRYLYVNRGFGFLAMPARIGILPEITVIELHKY